MKEFVCKGFTKFNVSASLTGCKVCTGIGDRAALYDTSALTFPRFICRISEYSLKTLDVRAYEFGNWQWFSNRCSLVRYPFVSSFFMTVKTVRRLKLVATTILATGVQRLAVKSPTEKLT
ncbi:MAG: hypothetical protein NTV34_16765 [Proteobacteria bacterium]|nr:hypothetical protein [Pseudomonadota bacterium]